MTQLDEILARLGSLDPKAKEALVAQTMAATGGLRWVPNPGPQTDAYHCQADELFYGGEPGGGKSDLLVGLALTAHEKSLVLRRTNKEANKLVDRFAEVLGTRDGWNGQDDIWRLPDRVIDIGGCQYEDDKQKYKGSPHDLIGFDEVSDFSESQYLFITIWNRSVNSRQRCRIVAAGNPPTRPEGLWVLKRWAAWLDIKHPNPAIPGELRWYMVNEEGDEVEVAGPGPYQVGKHLITAKSRTFIRSGLDDNPDLAQTDYRSRLASLTGHLRSAYHEADFAAGVQDAPNQLIPTAWVLEAQKRWTRQPPPNVPMCAMGVDCSGGGEDPMVIAPRYDGWFAPMIVTPGKALPKNALGKTQAGIIVANRKDSALVVVDMGGGYGGPVLEKLTENQIETFSYKGAEKTLKRTRDRKMGFKNVRTAALWAFREALDPGQDGGSPIALPDDPELRADLCAATFDTDTGVYRAETKEDVMEKIGRSPNKGDAVVMAWWSGIKPHTMPGYNPQQGIGRRKPAVVLRNPNRR